MVSNLPTGETSVFVDASVLFAASLSPGGYAYDLIQVGLRGQTDLVISPFVIQETRRNLLEKAPEALALFEAFLAPGLVRLVQPSSSLVERVASVIILKDAPIVAGALAAGAPLVATYDRKHLLSRRDEVFAAFGIIVATPGEILDGL